MNFLHNLAGNIFAANLNEKECLYYLQDYTSAKHVWHSRVLSSLMLAIVNLKLKIRSVKI